MKLVDTKLTLKELKQMAQRKFGGLVKAVVDIEKEVMVVDGDMHADEEKHLLDTGSDQNNLWGINIYPDETGDGFIEFDSIINIRPSLNNLSRNVEDKKIKEKIIKIVEKLVEK